MIGKTVSHYKVTRELGAGGMGVVYEAVDTKLDRTVALKFLPPESTRDPDAKARFIHEAKAASAIDHPNVCNIYEIDETDDGHLFLAMACYEGETLKDRIERGPLALDDALDITRQVAEGLTKAHERDIVHRDIKPANLFITNEGVVKILDFGLAKLAGLTKLTQEGTTLGTAHYMSPEQAGGQEVDHRSDLWCLGVCFYEMITGRVPFQGDHPQAVTYAILNSDPEPVTGLRTGVPLDLERIINKCLAKTPAERYQHSDELVADLIRLTRDSATKRLSKASTAAETSRRRQWPWMIGFTVLGFVIAFALWKMWMPAGPPAPPGEPCLAVMAFRDLPGSGNSESVGMVTELLNIAMVEASPVRVQSPEYLRDIRRRKYGSVNAAVKEGQELELARLSGATFILTGSMGQLEEEKLLTWRLVDVVDGQSIGAGRVSAPQMMEMVDEVVRSVLPLIAKSRGVHDIGEQIPVASITSASEVAYRHYLTGRDLIDRGKNVEGARELEAAVALDSTFAAAHLELAKYHFHRGESHVDISRARHHASLARRFQNHLDIRGRLSLEAFQYGLDYRVAKELEALRAIADRWPDDRDALKALQRKAYWWWQFETAVIVGEKGFELYPDDFSYVGDTYLAALHVLGRNQNLQKATRRYLEQNPSSPLAWEYLGDSYIAIGEPDSARSAYEKAIELDPQWPKNPIAAAVSATGDVDGAIAILEEELKQNELDIEYRYALLFRPYYGYGLCSANLFAGRYEDAIAAMTAARELTGDDPTLWQWQAGRVMADVGHAEDALRMALEMERSSEIRARVFALRFKAHAQIALGDLEGARATILRIRELIPEMGIFMAYYAYKAEAAIALEDGDPDSAIRALGELAKITWSSLSLPSYEDQMMLAQAQHMAGNFGEAIKELQGLIHKHRGYALAHYQLGICFEDIGEMDLAIQAYEDFLEIWHDADEGLEELNMARARLGALRMAH